jgi:iron(III) transport system substrate-binding protein
MPGRLAFASLLLSVIAQCAFAQADGARERRVDAATREGEVIWYTAMNTADGEVLRKRFEEKYAGVKLTILRQPGEKIRNRILAEQQAGKSLWDVVSFNHLDMDVLDREQLLASYLSPESAGAYPPGAVHPRGRWSAIYVRQYVVGYNTRSVAHGEAPTDWKDLLQPRWKGKLAIDENEVEWYAGMIDYLGRDKGVAYMRALARQGPQFRRGHTLLSKLLVAGDFPLALVHAAEIDEMKKTGAPVDWVRTLDPIVTSPSQVAISARAAHPNAARLLVDFLLSKEGQELIRSRGRVPARLDVAADSQATIKVHYVKPELGRDFDRHEKEFGDLFLKSR